MTEDIRIVECGPEDNPMDDEWEPEEDDIPEDEYGDFDEEWPTGPKIILGV